MEKYDFIVIGAGFAGLTAARQIQKSGGDVIVVEARNRIGGRVFTQKLEDGTIIDLGAQWIGPTQKRMAALVEEFSIETFITYDDGDNLIGIGEHIKRDRDMPLLRKLINYQGTIPRIGLLPLMNLGWAMVKIEKMATRINLEAPWETPDADKLDGMTLATWLDQTFHSKIAKKFFTIGLNTIFACEPSEISLLHALFYMRSGTSLDILLSSRGGAQQDLFIEGAQNVAQKLAQDLKIKLATPIYRIEQNTNSVTVVGEETRIVGKRVIVAIPPALAGKIDYSPPLPGIRDQLMQRMPMGSAIKCFAIYDKPFWREQGLSGHAVANLHPITVTFDCSPPSGKPGILLGFIEGNDARKFSQLSENERRTIALGNFTTLFGAEAKNIVHYLDKSWMEDPWARGGYVGYMPPGVWTGHGQALRASVGRIHWAGTETACRWNGYMDGAIESGERAAKEVLVAEQV